MDQHQDVTLEIGADGVAVLTVDRPNKMNALGWAAIDAFRAAVKRAGDDKHVRALVITGGGDRAFISGGDLGELRNFPDAADGLRLSTLMGEACEDIDHLEVPVIAAINGHSRGGGCEIAVACDIRILAENGSLGFVHVRQGISTAWGGAHRLKRLIGYGKAIELLLTGRIITPDEAHHLGLIEQVVPQGEAVNAARAVAATIAANPPQAVKALKRLVRLEANEAFAAEREAFAKLWATADHLEAVSAFLEKRKPVFSFTRES